MTQTKKATIGPNGKEVWFAYDKTGRMLRGKNGVGRSFKTERAALKAAKETT